MARVMDPFMSGKASGSIGSITATIGLSGPILKRKPLPVRRARLPQQRTRSIMGFCSRQYGELTDTQRVAWKAYAIDNPGTDPFGEPFIMSGINAFCMLNVAAMKKGGSGVYQVLPPSSQPPSSIWGLAANTGVGVPGDVDVNWTETGTGIAADFWEIWTAGPFQSPGRVEVHGKFTYNSQVAGNVLLTTIGGLLEGFFYWFKVRYVDEFGQPTAGMLAQATPMLTP